MTTYDAGQRIRERREQLNLRQQDLAARLNVSQSLVSQWERGKASPEAGMYKRLAALLEISVYDLYDRALGWANDLERAIEADTLLRSRREKDALLAAYGALVDRDSLKKIQLLRVHEDDQEADTGNARHE